MMNKIIFYFINPRRKKKQRKRKNVNKENLKYQVAKKLTCHVTLQNARINYDQATIEIRNKRIRISMLSKHNLILNEELKNIKEKWRKTENDHKDLNDKRMAPLSKKDKTVQETSKTLWKSQKLLKTTKEQKNCEKRMKQSELEGWFDLEEWKNDPFIARLLMIRFQWKRKKWSQKSVNFEVTFELRKKSVKAWRTMFMLSTAH